MSLESIHQKLRNAEKMSFWKFFLFSFVGGLISVGIVSFTNPTYLEQYNSPTVQFFLITMVTVSFTAMYLMLLAGGVAGGLFVTWALLKSRDNLYVKNGALIGKSLSTNHEFLRKLANGLHPKIIGFIRGYNDPKFEALQNQILEKDTRINELENLILPHIARQNRKQFDFDHRLKNLEQEKNEKIQTIGDKAQSKNNTENIDIKKFKEDL